MGLGLLGVRHSDGVRRGIKREGVVRLCIGRYKLYNYYFHASPPHDRRRACFTQGGFGPADATHLAFRAQCEHVIDLVSLSESLLFEVF